MTCLRFEGVPFTTGNLPDMPSIRVSPFSHTGIDFAGPVYVQSSSDTQIKAYICLFTCSSTRAVRLELTAGLDAHSFLLAFCRFSSRRGLLNTLILDIATTFLSCAKEILVIHQSVDVLNDFENCQISWRFIIEKAP